MLDKTQALLDVLDGELTPVRQLLGRFVGEDTVVDANTGTAKISHRPRMGPEAYAFILFPGIPADLIEKYAEVHAKPTGERFYIPEIYRKLLARLNGAFLLEVSLYGLPPSMCKIPPTLNRSVRQPFDLATANRNWSREYKPTPEQFMFGGAPYSYCENLGYFLKPDGGIQAKRKGGELFADWSSFEPFLSDELRRAESIFPEHEERMFALQQAYQSRNLKNQRNLT
jgi:hypothetical protein